MVRLTSLRCRVTVVTTRPKEMLLVSRDLPGRSAVWPASEQSSLWAAGFVLGRSSLSLEQSPGDREPGKLLEALLPKTGSLGRSLRAQL